MDKKGQGNREIIKQKSVNKNKSKKPQAEIVPWQNQEICIVDNLEKCRALAVKIRSYVKNNMILISSYLCIEMNFIIFYFQTLHQLQCTWY